MVSCFWDCRLVLLLFLFIILLTTTIVLVAVTYECQFDSVIGNVPWELDRVRGLFICLAFCGHCLKEKGHCFPIISFFQFNSLILTFHPQSHAAAVQENKMTVTLIAVVVLFLVCQTPTAIFLLYSSFVGEPVNRLEANLRLGKFRRPI